MKICVNCGTYMPDDAYSCPVCGSTVYQGVVAPRQYISTPVQRPKAKVGSKVAAGIGLFLSLVGMILFFVVIPAALLVATGQSTVSGLTADKIALSGVSAYGIGIVAGLLTSIIGTILGGISRNGIPSGAGGRGVATGALVVGIIGIVFNAMQVIIGLCVAGVSYAAYQSSISVILHTIFFM